MPRRLGIATLSQIGRRRALVGAVLIAPALLVAQRPVMFTYSGLSLQSDLDDLARLYVGAIRSGEFLHVSPSEVRDFVTGIGLSGQGPTRRLRITFETSAADGPPTYPKCSDIQVPLERRFGRPTAARAFDEEASRRSDRIWRASGEEMTLLCFRGATQRDAWWAEALLITAR